MLKMSIIFIVVFLMSIGTVYGDKCSGGPGAIWALHADGSSDDYFALGEDIYLGGQNFNATTEYYYEVLDIDDNKAVETNGTVWTNESGDIIIEKIWTIPSDDYLDHSYRIDLEYNECNEKIWTKKDSLETIPEFPTVAMPALLTLGGYLAIRLRRKYK